MMLRCASLYSIKCVTVESMGRVRVQISMIQGQREWHGPCCNRLVIQEMSFFRFIGGDFVEAGMSVIIRLRDLRMDVKKY